MDIHFCSVSCRCPLGRVQLVKRLRHDIAVLAKRCEYMAESGQVDLSAADLSTLAAEFARALITLRKTSGARRGALAQQRLSTPDRDGRQTSAVGGA